MHSPHRWETSHLNSPHLLSEIWRLQDRGFCGNLTFAVLEGSSLQQWLLIPHESYRKDAWYRAESKRRSLWEGKELEQELQIKSEAKSLSSDKLLWVTRRRNRAPSLCNIKRRLKVGLSCGLSLCAVNAGGLGSIPGEGTRSHKPRLRHGTVKYINNIFKVIESEFLPKLLFIYIRVCVCVCVCEVKWSESHSVMSNSLQPHGLYNSWNSPDQNTGMGSLSVFHGIFPTQGLNPGLPHCRRFLHQLSYQGSPCVCVYIYNLTKTGTLQLDLQTIFPSFLQLQILCTLEVQLFWQTGLSWSGLGLGSVSQLV